MTKAFYLLIKSLLVLGLFFLFSCDGNADREIDISNQRESVEFKRFEKALFGLSHIDSLAVNRLKEEYEDLFKVYVERVLNFGSIKDPALPLYLDHFTSDMGVQNLVKAVDTSFTSLEKEKQIIASGFKRLKVLFPMLKLPKVATTVNGFNYYNGTVLPKKIFVTQEYVAIGLDMYLGSNFDIYKKLGFPKYFLKTMNRSNIVGDLIKGYVYTEFFNPEELPDELVYRMIYEGRMLYLAKQLIPNEPFASVCGFTRKQLEWCENNEAQMWNTMVSNQLLYEKSAVKVDPFFVDGPFTKDFPKDSPAKAANWLGFKIVESYMRNNKDGIVELMKMKDMKNIFVSSKYKPS